MKKTQSMLETAYNIIKVKPVSFNELVEKVAEELEMTKEEVAERKSQFYTSLSLDQRFFYNGLWNLATNFKYEERKIEIHDLSSEDDDIIDKDSESSDSGEEDDYDHLYSEESDDDSSEDDGENDTL